MKIFVLIFCSYDGDDYMIFTESDKAYEAYTDECDNLKDSNHYHKIVLVETEIGKNFGSGSRGDFFGCEVLQEKDFQ